MVVDNNEFVKANPKSDMRSSKGLYFSPNTWVPSVFEKKVEAENKKFERDMSLNEEGRKERRFREIVKWMFPDNLLGENNSRDGFTDDVVRLYGTGDQALKAVELMVQVRASNNAVHERDGNDKRAKREEEHRRAELAQAKEIAMAKIAAEKALELMRIEEREKVRQAQLRESKFDEQINTWTAGDMYSNKGPINENIMAFLRSAETPEQRRDALKWFGIIDPPASRYTTADSILSVACAYFGYNGSNAPTTWEGLRVKMNL